MPKNETNRASAAPVFKRPYKAVEIKGRRRLVDLPTYLDIQAHPDPRLLRVCVHLATMGEPCSACAEATP